MTVRALRYAQAASWFRKAADQGYTSAQMNLAFMCERGKGVPQDYVQAYVWFTLAAALEDPDADKNRDTVAAKMTSAEIKKAQALAAA